MKPAQLLVVDMSLTLPRAPDVSTYGCLTAADFDAFDRKLLASALALGQRYAKVVKGTDGYWITMVSKDDPIDIIDRSAHRFAAVVRIDKIAGLAPPPATRFFMALKQREVVRREESPLSRRAAR